MDTDILLNLKKNRFFRNFERDSRLIFSIMGIVFTWAMIYLVFFYKPTYESNAKIWIKNLATEEFVASLDTQSQLTPLTPAGNPLLTQIEILKSDQLKNFIVEYKSMLGKKVGPNAVKLEVKNKPNTDVLSINLSDSSPESAQLTLKAVLEKYDKINLHINKKIRLARREYIDIKLTEISGKLLEVREKIKVYKSENLAIGIDEETNQLVGQGVLLSSKLEDTLSQIKNTESSVRELESHLSLKSREAIRAVALGSGNQTLVQLRNDLNTAVQEYNFDSAKLADTNPKMVAQKNKIAAINKQMKNQINLSIGKYAKSQHINIFDPVREKLVGELVEAQTRLMGLRAEEQAIITSINKINEVKSQMPEKKFILDNLEQEEKALSAAYDQLKEKQIEAKIKEAEAVSNVVVIDPPNLPKHSSFPSAFQVVFMSIMLGVIAGFGLSIVKTLVEDVCDDIEDIEEITANSVLGTIPWVENLMYDEQIDFIHGIAYNNIVSNLLVKCYKNNNKVLVFTSSSLKKPQSAVLYQIAKRLKKSGHSVIIIDSDFRIPSILNNVSVNNKISMNLSELIASIENKMRHKQTITSADINSAIVVDEEGISHIGNKDSIFEPYEFFGTYAFEAIIEKVKADYDWVLIDTGAAHITPEFLIISKLSDGVVLFVNKTITYSIIRNITKLIKSSNTTFVGTIVREPNSRLEQEYEKYLKFQESKLLNDDEIDSLLI